MHKLYPLVNSVPTYNFLPYKEGGGVEKKEKMFLREILVTVKRDCGLKPLFFFSTSAFYSAWEKLKNGYIQVFLT